MSKREEKKSLREFQRITNGYQRDAEDLEGKEVIITNNTATINITEKKASRAPDKTAEDADVTMIMEVMFGVHSAAIAFKYENTHNAAVYRRVHPVFMKLVTESSRAHGMKGISGYPLAFIGLLVRYSDPLPFIGSVTMAIKDKKDGKVVNFAEVLGFDDEDFRNMMKCVNFAVKDASENDGSAMIFILMDEWMETMLETHNPMSVFALLLEGLLAWCGTTTSLRKELKDTTDLLRTTGASLAAKDKSLEKARKRVAAEKERNAPLRKELADAQRLLAEQRKRGAAMEAAAAVSEERKAALDETTARIAAVEQALAEARAENAGLAARLEDTEQRRNASKMFAQAAKQAMEPQGLPRVLDELSVSEQMHSLSAAELDALGQSCIALGGVCLSEATKRDH